MSKIPDAIVFDAHTIKKNTLAMVSDAYGVLSDAQAMLTSLSQNGVS